MGVACKRGGFNASIHMGGALPSDVRGDCGFGVGKFDPLDHGGIWRGYSEVGAIAGAAQAAQSALAPSVRRGLGRARVGLRRKSSYCARLTYLVGEARLFASEAAGTRSPAR